MTVKHRACAIKNMLPRVCAHTSSLRLNKRIPRTHQHTMHHGVYVYIICEHDMLHFHRTKK